MYLTCLPRWAVNSNKVHFTPSCHELVAFGRLASWKFGRAQMPEGERGKSDTKPSIGGAPPCHICIEMLITITPIRRRPAHARIHAQLRHGKLCPLRSTTQRIDPCEQKLKVSHTVLVCCAPDAVVVLVKLTQARGRSILDAGVELRANHRPKTWSSDAGPVVTRYLQPQRLHG